MIILKYRLSILEKKGRLIIANTYTTIQGDTWDRIAYQTLGSEYLLPFLLELKENREHQTTVIFEGGITITIPDIEIRKVSSKRPSWLGEVEEL